MNKWVNILNTVASTRKENIMENMSTYELETFLKMILEILNGCKDIEEARKKIKALLERWAGLQPNQKQTVTCPPFAIDKNIIAPNK